jgi:hypothetical protein
MFAHLGYLLRGNDLTLAPWLHVAYSSLALGS